MGRTRKAINFLAYRDPTARHPKNKLTRGKQRKAGPRILLALRLVYHLFVMFASTIKQMKKGPFPHFLSHPGTPDRPGTKGRRTRGNKDATAVPSSQRKIQKEDVPRLMKTQAAWLLFGMPTRQGPSIGKPHPFSCSFDLGCAPSPSR